MFEKGIGVLVVRLNRRGARWPILVSRSPDEIDRHQRFNATADANPPVGVPGVAVECDQTISGSGAIMVSAWQVSPQNV